MNRRDNIELDAAQKQLVRAFLLTILPPIKSKRHGKNNELLTITSAIDKWFKRNFQFHVGLTALAELFEELEPNGYTMRPMGEDYDPDTKTARAVLELGDSRDEQPYDKRQAMYIYINVEPTRVTSIRRLNTTLPPSTNPDKLMDLVTIQEELRSFLVKDLGR